MPTLLEETLALRARFDEEPSHSDHVCMLALLIYDGLRPWHGLDKRFRELLNSAALLHDIGWSQTPDGKGHHKWSARLIQEQTWKSLTKSEVVLVAQTARYHRKSPPQPEHEAFNELSPGAQKKVMLLGGILRLADALDRTHTGKIQYLETRITKAALIIQVRPAGVWDAERMMFDNKRDMLQLAAARPVLCEEMKW